MSAAVLTRVARRGVAHVHTLHDYWLLCQRNTMVTAGGVNCTTRCRTCRAVSAVRNAQLARGIRPTSCSQCRRRWPAPTRRPWPGRGAGPGCCTTRWSPRRGLARHRVPGAPLDVRVPRAGERGQGDPDPGPCVRGRGPPRRASPGRRPGHRRRRGHRRSFGGLPRLGGRGRQGGALRRDRCAGRAVGVGGPRTARGERGTRAAGSPSSAPRAGGIPELISPASAPLLFAPGALDQLTARLRTFAAAPGAFAADPEAAPIDWAGHLAGVTAAYTRARAHGATERGDR